MTNNETAFNDEELSISDATLIARLRTLATNMFQSGHWGNDLDTTKDAADRIEALINVRDTLRRLLAKQTARAERLEAERDALIVVLADCPIPQVAEEARTTIARLKGADHE